MPAKAASGRTQAKSSPNTNKSAKSTRKTRQQPDSANEEKEQPSTSSYFKKQPKYDSDALDEDSDAGVKKRKSTARGSKSAPPTQNKKRKIEKADEDYDEEAEASASEKPYDSDALDEDSDGPTAKPKRKGRASATTSPKKTQSPRKKKQVDNGDANYDDLEDGQEVVGVVVQAPKTGHVPAGQISQNTFNFLNRLQDPVCNDREWYVHVPSSLLSSCVNTSPRFKLNGTLLHVWFKKRLLNSYF